MVVLLSLIPAAIEATVSIANANSEYVDALKELTGKLEVIGHNMGGTTPTPSEPPPGI